jgi:AraC-like DNA-binding protein
MYRAIRPHPQLASVVDEFWRFDGSGRPHRVVPDGCMDFLFDLDDDRGGIVIGPMAKAKIVRLRAGARIFAVRFRPGAASLYVDAVARELCDRDCPVTDVTPAARFRLADRILEAHDDADRCRVLGDFLLGGARRVRPADARVGRAIDLIASSRGAAPVNEVARRVAVGERQLERLFLERVGVGPKYFARIARLRYAGELLCGPSERHAALAVRAGYADQAHFVRECRSIFGDTPTVIARERRVGFVQAEEASVASS